MLKTVVPGSVILAALRLVYEQQQQNCAPRSPHNVQHFARPYSHSPCLGSGDLLIGVQRDLGRFIQPTGSTAQCFPPVSAMHPKHLTLFVIILVRTRRRNGVAPMRSKSRSTGLRGSASLSPLPSPFPPFRRSSAFSSFLSRFSRGGRTPPI